MNGVTHCFSNLGVTTLNNTWETCHKAHARLPIPKNEQEVVDFYTIIQKLKINSLFYTGIALDIRKEKGNWTNSHGSQLNFTNWNEGQPKNDVEKSYATILTRKKWGAFSGDSRAVVVCQQKVHPSTPLTQDANNAIAKTNSDLDKKFLANRLEKCSLENAINATIDGRLFCLSRIGVMKHEAAFKTCKDLNATLPLPRNLVENNDFTSALSRLGIDEISIDLETNIILDLRRKPDKGTVLFSSL